MAEFITITPAGHSLADARDLLNEKQYNDAIRRAQNRTAGTLKTRISTRLREIINIKKRDLDPLIMLKRANYDRDATITVTRKPMSLRFYSPTQTKAGVKVKIWKDKGPELLRSTFKITSGASPVYERQRLSAGTDKRRVPRFPLQQRFGPTGVGVLAGHPGVLDEVLTEGGEIFAKNVDSQTNFILGRSKLR